jgi:polysaccharide pyruvyl transferase WcaK-like protein
MRILILGYYHRKNFGDDLFEYVFRKYVFSSDEYDLTIINMDDIQTIFRGLDNGTIKQFDRIVVGGGDLINEYYFRESNIATFRRYFVGVPLFFYGVGLSYPDLLPILDIGDFFFMRNKIDHEVVKRRYGVKYSSYTPDLAYFLCNEDSLKVYKNEKSSVQKIGFCLPHTWFENSKKNTQQFFNQIITLICDLSKHHQVYVIPFDTSINKRNSDLILSERIREKIKEKDFDSQGNQRIFFKDEAQMTPVQMIECFKTLDLVFASRFHSVIMCLLTETPFVSLYTTRKIENMMSELSLDLRSSFIKVDTDSDFVPRSLDRSLVDSTFESIKSRYRDVAESIRNNKKYLFGLLNKSWQQCMIVMKSRDGRHAPPQYVSNAEKSKIISKTVDSVLTLLGKFSTRTKDKVMEDIPLAKIITKRNVSIPSVVQKIITEEVLWCITGDPYAPYYYGLFENVLTNNFVSQLKWLVDDYYKTYKYKTLHSEWITIVNKNFQEVHRSGWQFIVNNMVAELNNTDGISRNLIIDTYVDKTFHWNKMFYERQGVIPYTKNWIGFIHHTFSSYNNSYNCETLFQDDMFRSSLEHCKCLIVMSEYLKRQIEQILHEMYNDPMKPLTNRVVVEVIYHPSEMTETMFTWENFVSNPDKQLVQVGNWLRNVFEIYRLDLPRNSIIKQKSVLKNRNTENYFLPDGFFDDLFRKLDMLREPPSNVVDICKISFQNMHLKGMYEYIMEMENSVRVVEYLDNDKYDNLLANNVVFVNLVDASAVNTIVECVLRNTPILVNPIDPVVEVLGPGYPFYYNSAYEASRLLESEHLIKQTHQYLQTLDKSNFLIETFVLKMKEILSRHV